MACGEQVVLEIDVQGALQVMQRRPDAISVFIAPPSYAELKRRLAGRGDTPPDIAARRLHIALEECRQAKHYQIYHHQRFRRARRAGAGSSPDRGGLPHILSPTQSQGGRLIMLYPAMADLLKHIDSRYLLVNVIARRARQISIEAETEHIPLEDKPVTIAIHEVADGKLAAVVKE